MTFRKALTLIFILVFIFASSHAADVYAVDGESQATEGRAYASGQLLLRFADQASESERARIRSAYGFEILKTFDTGIELVGIGRGADPAVLAAALARSPVVVYAQPDYIIERPRNAVRGISTSDPGSSELWGLDVIDAPEAWAEGASGSGIVVAVVDSGIMTTHEDLAGNMWVNPGEGPVPNGIDDDGNGLVDDIHGWNVLDETGEVFEGFDVLDADGYPQDEHGTHVAGTIAAVGNNGLGVIGVAPDVDLMSLKFFGSHSSSGLTSEAVQAIEYAAAMGADVINASWGGGGGNAALQDAIAAFPGIFVAAAGNDGEDTDSRPHYPSSYPGSNILSVASSDWQENDETGILSVFSNYGDTTVDIAAPGGGIFQGYVRIRGRLYMSYSDLILSTYPYEEGTQWTDRYDRMGGTSMAAPHVTGVVALMLSTGNYAGSQPADVITDLMVSGSPHPTLDGMVASGNVLNAYGAVTEYANSMNEAPVAYADYYSMSEDGVLTVPAAGVLANDTDFESDPLAAVLVDDVNHGTLTLNSNGSFTYEPDDDFDAVDSFTYRAYDGKYSNLATVTITVNGVNDAPVAEDDSYRTDTDTMLVVNIPGVLDNDIDADGDTLTAELYQGTGYGTVSLEPDGSFGYIPNPGYSGPDSFTYRVSDGILYSNIATVNIDVDPPGPAVQYDVSFLSPDEGTAFTTRDKITIQVSVISLETMEAASGIPVGFSVRQYNGDTVVNELLNQTAVTRNRGTASVSYRVAAGDPRGSYVIEVTVDGVVYTRNIVIN